MHWVILPSGLRLNLAAFAEARDEGDSVRFLSADIDLDLDRSIIVDGLDAAALRNYLLAIGHPLHRPVEPITCCRRDCDANTWPPYDDVQQQDEWLARHGWTGTINGGRYCPLCSIALALCPAPQRYSLPLSAQVIGEDGDG